MARRREAEQVDVTPADVEWWRTCARYMARMHDFLPRDLSPNAVMELSDDELRALAEDAGDQPGAADVLRYLDRGAEAQAA